MKAERTYVINRGIPMRYREESLDPIVRPFAGNSVKCHSNAG